MRGILVVQSQPKEHSSRVVENIERTQKFAYESEGFDLEGNEAIMFMYPIERDGTLRKKFWRVPANMVSIERAKNYYLNLKK